MKITTCPEEAIRLSRDGPVRVVDGEGKRIATVSRPSFEEHPLEERVEALERQIQNLQTQLNDIASRTSIFDRFP